MREISISAKTVDRNPKHRFLGLIESWIKLNHEESGLPYYFNIQTGESKWAGHVDSDGTFIPEADLEETKWEKHFDESGYPYYFNQVKKYTYTRNIITRWLN